MMRSVYRIGQSLLRSKQQHAFARKLFPPLTAATAAVGFGYNSLAHASSSSGRQQQQPKRDFLHTDGQHIRLQEVSFPSAIQGAKTIIIGDIHGCNVELLDLLKACQYTPGDLVVSVGDMVGKGPDSRGVIRTLQQLNAVAVLGNHDVFALDTYRGVKTARDPLYGEHVRTFSATDIAWMSNLPYLLRINLPLAQSSVLVVHAGIWPGKPLSEQDPVQCVLMRNMFAVKGGGGSLKPTSIFEKGTAWVSHYTGPEMVVFGHDARRGLQLASHAIGLDTACCYGGQLTALVISEEDAISPPPATGTGTTATGTGTTATDTGTEGWKQVRQFGGSNGYTGYIVSVPARENYAPI
jgi:hypothetical protein